MRTIVFLPIFYFHEKFITSNARHSCYSHHSHRLLRVRVYLCLCIDFDFVIYLRKLLNLR